MNGKKFWKYVPLKKNKIYFFYKPNDEVINRSKKQLYCVKENKKLFSRVYIAYQEHKGNLDEFFHHKDQGFPLPISEYVISVEERGS